MIRILLAEDDESMRTYLTRALERVGFTVISVDRGTAALPLLEAEPFDLLLTDIVMPELDGIELAQRAATIAPGMRVMFITGFAAVALNRSRPTHNVPIANALCMTLPWDALRQTLAGRSESGTHRYHRTISMRSSALPSHPLVKVG